MRKRINQCLGVLTYFMLAAILISVMKKVSLSFFGKGRFSTASVISFALAYIFSVLVHELSHFCAFWYLGIKVRMIALFGIVIIFNEKCIKVSIYPRMCLGGGWVLPRMSFIGSSEDYNKYKKNFCFSLAIAPIISLLMMFVLILVNAFIPMGRMFKEFVFFFSVFAIVLNITSLFGTDNMWGDYYAFYKYKKDDFSFLYHVCRNHVIMSTSSDLPISTYMAERIKSELVSNVTDIEECFSDERIAYMVDFAIKRYLIFQEEMGKEIERLVSFYIDISEKIAVKDGPEELKILFIHLIYYLKYNHDERWRKLVSLSENLFDDKGISRYYGMQIRQFCFREDHSEFLLDEMNIKTSSFWEIEHILGAPQLEERNLYQIFELNSSVILRGLES